MNRHGKRSVSRPFPNVLIRDPNGRDIVSVRLFCLSAPPKRESKAQAVKGLPARDAREFYLCFSFCDFLEIAARLWRTKPLSQHPEDERQNRLAV
ncbi:MAG TPA: hypothetical protein H9690_02275 [Firmicutes bacterium]|nr:hypothetical protein [Bacillota bacterium]